MRPGKPIAALLFSLLIGCSGASSGSNPNAPRARRAKGTGSSRSGAGVLHWWLMTDFRGNEAVFDSSDKPTGRGGTLVENVDKTLRLADEADIDSMPRLSLTSLRFSRRATLEVKRFATAPQSYVMPRNARCSSKTRFAFSPRS